VPVLLRRIPQQQSVRRLKTDASAPAALASTGSSSSNLAYSGSLPDDSPVVNLDDRGAGDDEDIAQTPSSGSNNNARSSRQQQLQEQHRQQSRPLLQNSAQQNRHRRMMSVEEQLADLTSAMSRFSDHDSHHHQDRPRYQEEREQDGGLSGADVPETTKASSAWTLVRNATLLTQHRNDDKKSQRQLFLETVPEGSQHGAGSSDGGGGDGNSSPGGQRIDSEGNITAMTNQSPSGSISDENNGDGSLSGERGDGDIEMGNGTKSKKQSGGTGSSSQGGRKIKTVAGVANDKLKEDWEIWKSFFSPRKDQVWYYLRVVVLHLIIPATALSAILFYLADNPPTGVVERTDAADSNSTIFIASAPNVYDNSTASASWWLLFICVRQVVTFSLAMLLQFLIIDFLCLGTRVMLRLLGPVLTLLLAQSRGWPFVTLMWCSMNFALLYGNTAFAHHWAYWQDAVGLFNGENPSGNVVDSEWYFRLLIIGVAVSCVVAVKRLLVGIFLGRQTYGMF